MPWRARLGFMEVEVEQLSAGGAYFRSVGTWAGLCRLVPGGHFWIFVFVCFSEFLVYIMQFRKWLEIV